jgi:hypothetical protein
MANTGNVFKDYIPAGEDQGGQGKGFVDYVPKAEPVFHPEEKPVEPVQPVIPEPVKEPVVETPVIKEK